jgi:hypothetical protein
VPRRRRRLRPFTTAHFREYSKRLVLDTGEPWELEPFQVEIVRDLFKGPAVCRELWILLPEESGKTTLIAGLALYGADYSPSPWIPIAASSRDQVADGLYGQAAEMVRRSPGLDKRFRPQDGHRRILSLRNGGRGIKVYAADKGTADGVIPFPYAFVDEGHRHRDLGLYRTWKGKLRKRGAQLAMISTAGEPGSDFEETRDQIRELAVKRRRRGAHLRVEGGRVVMHEWRVDAGRVRNLRAVKSANPRASIEELREKFESPTLDFGEDWVRLTCNIPARSSLAAITDQEFDAAETGVRIPEGVSVDVGLDVAWKYDTTALAPLWMRDRHFRLFDRTVVLEPPRDGTMLNPHLIEDAFREIHDRNPIGRVVADREKAEQLCSWLEEELGVEVVERGRTNEPASFDYEKFMEGLRGKGAGSWIKHTGDPVFRQQAMNAVVRRLPGDRKRFDRPTPSRKNVREQHRRVIDLLDAASMVHSVTAATFDDAPDLKPADYVPEFV